MKASIGISTVLPTYITRPIHVQQLKRSIESVLAQTFKPSELIISDNSPNLEAFDVVRKMNIQKSKIVVKLLDARSQLGISRNSNFGIGNATQEVLHIIHQDDFLVGEETYSKAIEVFQKNEDEKWLVVSRIQNKNIIHPTDDSLLFFGYNTLGGPSCILARKIPELYFREDLQFFLDVDLYDRIYSEYGYPYLLHDNYINLNQIGPRVSNILPIRAKVKELIYLVADSNRSLSEVSNSEILRRTSMMNVGEVISLAKIELSKGFLELFRNYLTLYTLRFWAWFRHYRISNFIRKFLQKFFK